MSILGLAVLTSFEVMARSGAYQVEVGLDAFSRLIAARPQDIVLCDSYCSEKLAGHAGSVIAIEATEEAKSLERMAPVIECLREAGGNRHSSVLAVGGGVIQDIATFCASVYMRGVEWRYAPTTLLGMVDSCIGGKSAINVGKYKNIVGNFYPPKSVIVDPGFTDTLSVEQRVAGLCEAAKICFAGGPDVFGRYMALGGEPAMPLEPLVELIALSLATKKAIIERDEFDQNERLLLNFGHTFGHAIEGASDFAISHGVAVGLGILAAIHFSAEAGRQGCAPVVARLADYLTGLLAHVPGLSRRCTALVPEDCLQRFLADKKHKASSMALVVPDASGSLVLRELPRTDVNLRQVRDTFGHIAREHPLIWVRGDQSFASV